MGKRRFLIVLFVTLALLATATVAYAVTYGEPDGNGHPNVGILAAEFENPDGSTGIYGFCSGTLISPTVFLTAGHCVSWLPPGAVVYVSFDPEFAGAGSALHSGSFVLHPEYWHDFARANDLAVVLLDKAVTGVTPATLPPAGYFDELGPRGLRGQQFTAVGYGDTEPAIGGGPPEWSGFGVRRVAVSSFNALNNNWLRLSQNTHTGDAGTCYGDSGGPNFFGAGAGETSMIAGITSTGDAMCLATNTIYRVDTPSARAFLGQFVALP